MSATKRQKASGRLLRARQGACCRFSSPGRRHLTAGCGCSSPSAIVASFLLIATMLLIFAGCTSLRRDDSARTAPPPAVGASPTQPVVPAPKQPEAPAKPAPPAGQQPRRITEAKALAAVATKAAEKPAVASAVARVPAAERATVVKAELVRARERTATAVATEADTPVRELVFKGPAPPAKSQMSVMRVVKYVGILLGVGALGIVMRLARISRSTAIIVPNEKKKDDLAPVPGLLLKEPVELTPGPMVADES